MEVAVLRFLANGANGVSVKILQHALDYCVGDRERRVGCSCILEMAKVGRDSLEHCSDDNVSGMSRCFIGLCDWAIGSLQTILELGLQCATVSRPCQPSVDRESSSQMHARKDCPCEKKFHPNLARHPPSLFKSHHCA